MAQKKEIRADNTYIISTDNTDNPKLGAKILSDGRESLFLDYYFGYAMVYDEAKDKMVARKDRKRDLKRDSTDEQDRITKRCQDDDQRGGARWQACGV